MPSGSTCSTSGTLIVCFFKSITILSGTFLPELNCLDVKLSSFISFSTSTSGFTDITSRSFVLLFDSFILSLLSFLEASLDILLEVWFEVLERDESLELLDVRFLDLLEYSLMYDRDRERFNLCRDLDDDLLLWCLSLVFEVLSVDLDLLVLSADLDRLLRWVLWIEVLLLRDRLK